MNAKLKYDADFGGYATKADLECADGRIIKARAFKHNDGVKVPLIWQHQHTSLESVLGHGYLESRDDGVYIYGKFNDTEPAKRAQRLLQHGDLTQLSIFANGLRQEGPNVIHGNIREVSLVMAGANPGAIIENVRLAHSDGASDDVDVLIVSQDQIEFIRHSDGDIIAFDTVVGDEDLQHKDDAKDEKTDDKDTNNEDKDDVDDDMSTQDVLDSMSEVQTAVVVELVERAFIAGKEAEAETTAKHSSSIEDEDTLNHSQVGNTMSRNVFMTHSATGEKLGELSHSAFAAEVFDGLDSGKLSDAVKNTALAHGIENIETLFPEAKDSSGKIHLVGRQVAWVAKVLAGVTRVPWSKIKSYSADITADEARARGYIKGSLKEEEYFSVAKRVTDATTIYKVQKLDRDDVVDITDFDVVVFLKDEMRLMLEEEVAVSILIGDGRSSADKFKVREDRIRPIAKDHSLYQTTVFVNINDADSNPDEIVDAIIAHRHHYRGSGQPALFISDEALAQLTNAKDSLGRRLYKSLEEIATLLRVSEIVPVEAFNREADLVGILVDLRDYHVGANKGGQVNFFDDFDIDYNKLEYLIETRISGALVKPYSAMVLRKVAGSSVLVAPEELIVVDNVIAIPTVTGVAYRNADTNAAITADVTLTSGQTIRIKAVPASNAYYFASTVDTEWEFSYEG